MELIDLTGPVTTETWHYDPPYFSPRIEALPSPDWLEYPIYSESVSMPMQSGTYLETAAHVYTDREKTADLPLRRTVLLPSLCVQIPVPARTGLTARMIKNALPREGRSRLLGRGLLVATGWHIHWSDPEFLTHGPYFLPDAIEFILGCGVSLLGADLPRWDNPVEPTGHLRRFFESDALMLAPLYGLDRVGDAEGSLIAAPLAVVGTSASPVRAVWVGGAPNLTGLPGQGALT